MFPHNHKRMKSQRNSYYYLYMDDRSATAKYIVAPLVVALISCVLLIADQILRSQLVEPATTEQKQIQPLPPPQE